VSVSSAYDDVLVESFVGVGPRIAGRQAAALFALAGLLAVAGVGLTPGRAPELLAIAVADLLVAGAAWWLPWQRWGPSGTLWLALPAFAVLGFSTWLFGGFAAGTGPFFLLVYAWAGLNHPPRAIAAITPPAVVAYVVPLLAAGQPAPVVSSVAVLVPTAVGIGLLIAHQVRHQRLDRERIAQAERWRAALAATLAHDLRSPVTTVRLVLEALRSEGESMPARERETMLATALRQVGRIGRLAAGLLDAERVDSQGELRLSLRQVPLRRAVAQALEQLDAPQVVVEVDADLAVTADADRLEQILVNLTGNALRHGRPPVVIRAHAEDGVARVEVRDHGPGVPAEDRDQLFSRFGVVSSHPNSVGLGLWIVCQLARAHGGDVHYEAADPGARLVLTLPAALRVDHEVVGTTRRGGRQ
jgi:signal transduction histidine kinase